MDELQRLCQQLQPLIGHQAETLWKYYEMADSHQARMQSAQMIRMVASSYLGSDLEQRQIRLPPPARALLKGPIKVGEALYSNQAHGTIGLHPIELTRHIGIFGTTGSGKTTLTWSLLRQFQKMKIPFLAIDWKRSYRGLRGFPEFSNLPVFTIGQESQPLVWNPIRPPPGSNYETWIAIIAEIFEHSHVGGQGVAEVLIDASIREREATGASSDSFPTLASIRDRITRTRETGRKALWRDSALRILRTFTLGPLAHALSAPAAPPFEQLLEHSAILELDMALPANTRTFLAETIMRWIHLYRLHQGESRTLRHVIVLEEAHNILRQRVESGLESLYRELRSFGQGLISITQHPSSLPIYVLGNTHTVVFMQLTHEADIVAARQALFLDRDQDRFLDALATGEGILKVKGRIPAVHAKFPLVEPPKGQSPPRIGKAR